MLTILQTISIDQVFLLWSNPYFVKKKLIVQLLFFVNTCWQECYNLTKMFPCNVLDPFYDILQVLFIISFSILLPDFIWYLHFSKYLISKYVCKSIHNNNCMWYLLTRPTITYDKTGIYIWCFSYNNNTYLYSAFLWNNSKRCVTYKYQINNMQTNNIRFRIQIKHTVKEIKT